jgi:hypothetical protein
MSEVQCINQANKKLDDELNTAYKTALAVRPKKDQWDGRRDCEQPRKSQRAWLKCKEENCTLIGGLEGGSNLSVSECDSQCEKKRPLSASNFYNVLPTLNLPDDGHKRPEPDNHGRSSKMESLRLRLIYDGNGPLNWSRRPGMFGMQDKEGRLQIGTLGPDGTTEFEFELRIKTGKSGEPTLNGSFAHGPSSGRFVYLAWAEEAGTLAQRIKLPLGGIGWDDIRESFEQQRPLVGVLTDHHPRVTSTGANIGGSRQISWRLL